MHRAAFRFFDATFVLETDTASFLSRFEQSYGRFKIAEEIVGPVYRVTLDGQPSATLGSRTVQAAEAEALSTYAYNAIVNDVLARVRTHLLLHAAAVRTTSGQGVILAGDAGLGKTTLTIALLQRGLGFLSDDVAAIGRADGWLYPFPRQPGQRLPGGLPGEKRILEIEGISSACPPRFLFVLTDPDANTEGQPWHLVLDRVEEALLADLRAVAGVREAQVVRAEPFPAVRLDLAPGMLRSVEREIEALCQRHRNLLFEMVQGREAPPDFSGPPRLAPLSALEAARALLGHYKGGPWSAVLQHGFGGRASQFYLALVELSTGMACYRLDVGHLRSMVNSILAAVGGGPV